MIQCHCVHFEDWDLHNFDRLVPLTLLVFNLETEGDLSLKWVKAQTVAAAKIFFARIALLRPDWVAIHRSRIAVLRPNWVAVE